MRYNISEKEFKVSSNRFLSKINAFNRDLATCSTASFLIIFISLNEKEKRMTKPQIWVAAFLVFFLLLFVLGQITKKEDTKKALPEQNTVPQSNLSSENLSASELVGKLGCISCHGSDLKGTRMGPPLQGLKEFWGRDKLINFLRNPSSYSDTDRFKEYRKKYPGLIMPSFNQVNVKELGKIADYLLEQE